MASLTLPTFSLPKTRTEHNATLLKISKAFQSQGISQNDANTMASQLITFREQELTDAQILKNFDATFIASAKRFAEQQAKIKAEQEKQKPLLDQLAKAQAERKALASKTANAEARTKEEIRNFNKNKTVLVANPENPRGALIPLEQAQEIQRKLEAKRGLAGQSQSSSTQKNNPSIVESLRNLITTQKTAVEVIGINKTYVQLSNGQLVPRNEFKGTIPQKFLDAEKITTTSKPVTPDNAPFGGITTKGGSKVVVDPTKTPATATKTTDPSKIQTVVLPDNVKAQLDFLKSLNPKIDAKVFDPLGDLAKSLNLAFSQGQEVFTNTVNTIQKGIETTFTNPEPAKQTVPDVTKPFDPLGDLTNFFTNLVPKTETSTPTETKFDPLGDFGKFITSLIPKPTETTTAPAPTEPEPTPNKPTLPTEPVIIPHGDPQDQPIPEPHKTILKVSKFVSENSIKIIIGAFAVSSIIGLSMALSKNQRNEILQRYK